MLLNKNLKFNILMVITLRNGTSLDIMLVVMFTSAILTFK